VKGKRDLGRAWDEHLARGQSRAGRPCHLLAVVLSLLVLIHFTRPAMACGPSFIEPIFVFKESPDLPFEEFTRGKIGIVQPTFGLKTLVIAYRYLNGGTFTIDEQKALVEALRGTPPEDDEGQARAIKAWVAARKEFLDENEKLPDIYTERRYGGYDFFPNCAQNAFEVATTTLKDRASRYGVEDKNLRAWLRAQDTVFQNCSGGATLPEELGPGSSTWLRKDREYQIAAALFYSLNLEAAQARFEKIAADSESPWQRTADYLVARSLVRQASLTTDEKRRREAYERAEVRLQMVLAGNSTFYDAALKLLALVKYRAHPQERLGELARTLADRSGNANLRQDLIDYVWLHDKFQAQVSEAERRRKEALANAEKVQEPSGFINGLATKAHSDEIQSGALIGITIYARRDDGEPDYLHFYSKDFKYDASEAEIIQTFELELGKKLGLEQIKEIKERHASALANRDWLLSPNRKLEDHASPRYEGCSYDCDKIKLDLLAEFLRSDDLSDWIVTLQSSDPTAYEHALSKWRDIDSPAWLLTCIAKAEPSAPETRRLMRAAAKVSRDAPAFPTIAYHLIRLKIATGNTAEARQLLDEIISWPVEILPVSARNQFMQQRMLLAENLTEFLKFAQRKPAAFFDEGRYGTISNLMKISKNRWSPEDYEETKEEYEQEVEKNFKDLLPWDTQSAFDDETVDVLNWHFSLETLAAAARNHALPNYLRRRLILAVWTRAVVLENDAAAQKIAPEVPKVAPEMKSVFSEYLSASTAKERHTAALYVLLKFPNLSPFVAGGIPTFTTSEESSYDFEMAWWCEASATEYNGEGQEAPKVVAKPNFLTPQELDGARREFARLVAIGNGKSYLGKQVIQWAKVSPKDARLPEALFITVKANESYKYGCGGWDHDEETRLEAEEMLQQRYQRSPWTAKLHESEN
jgi:hypothetical protein